MKKREKFLLAFAISFCVVTCVYFVRTLKTMRYYSLHAKELMEWMYHVGIGVDYENITEEGKEYLENKLKEREQREKEWEIETKQYCDENPDECAESFDEWKQKIANEAYEYDEGHIMPEVMTASNYLNNLWDYINIAFAIAWLTLVIYSIITLEFKNVKQYIMYILKVVLIIWSIEKVNSI